MKRIVDQSVLHDMDRALNLLEGAHKRFEELAKTLAQSQYVVSDEAPDAAPDAALHMSSEGVEFLMELEGVRLEPYQDVAGIWTIGVGHVINDDEDVLREGISLNKAYDLLRTDLAWAERTVWEGCNAQARAHLSAQQYSPHRFDALVCFCFNVGPQAFMTSTLLRRVNAAMFDEVPIQMARWVYITNPLTGDKEVSPGLANRRRKTGRLWKTGGYHQ